MPLFVNKLVFSIIPTRVPFFMRPIARLLFGSVTKQMLDPKIEANLKFVSLVCIALFFGSCTLTPRCTHR